MELGKFGDFLSESASMFGGTTNFSDKTMNVLNEINKILDEYSVRMTIRQIYYQLVTRGIIENSLKSYKRYDKIITDGRKQFIVDPNAIVDRSKPMIKKPSWPDLSEFMESVGSAYQKSIWPDQENYIEVWIEKDALSGVIQPVTEKYDCQMHIGRGYQSFSNKYEAANRFKEIDKQIIILYLGDFDPTGIDISRDLETQLQDLGTYPKIERVALNRNQVDEYNLPPIPTKPTDSRTRKHIQQYGDMAVELDALPPNVLTRITEGAILKHLDFGAYQNTLRQQQEEENQIKEWVKSV